MNAPAPGRRPARHTGCNVYQPQDTGGRLWQFSFSQGQVHLQSDTAPDRLPAAVASRGWRQLFQPRLNLAWLPPDQVFVRIILLPVADPAEIPAMLELQLEKFSPLPVTQVVWSFETLPDSAPGQAAVVLLIAARAAVEEYLGRLEAAGYLADRLELPLLHRVLSDNPAGACVRLHLAPAPGRMACLAAWWQDGRLDSLDLISVPDDERGPGLWIGHLNRLSWAAELHGGWTERLRWEVVSPPESGPRWADALRAWVGPEHCRAEDALSDRDLALLAARRTASGATRANLLPPDAAGRYRQQLLDRVWMRALAALVVLYVLGVLVQAARVKVAQHRSAQLETEITQLAPAYTNAVELRERLRVFQEQAGLKYAALNCLLAVSERLPSELTLQSFGFESGTHLFLAGTVPSEAQAKVTEFNADLRRAVVDRELLFDATGVEAPKFAPAPNDTYRWDFRAKLKSPWLE